MKKALNYPLAYLLWVLDLGLALWLVIYSRTVLLSLFALLFDPTNWHNSKMMNVFGITTMVVFGLGWLIFMIVTEQNFRSGASRGDLPRRFARITGPLLLALFVIDLIQFWLRANSSDWLQWLILALELGGGIGLLVAAKTRLTPKPT